MTDLVQRLRDLGQGRLEWRVQDPKDGAYCIAFSRGDGYSLDPEREAREWLAGHKRDFPTSTRAGYVVAEVRVQSAKDVALCDAADEIERLRAALAAHAAPGVAPTAEQIALLDPWMRPAAARELLCKVLAAAPTAAQPVAPPYVTHLDQIDAEKEARDWLNAMIPADRRRAFWQWETFSFSPQDGRVHLLRAHDKPFAAALIVREGLNRSQLLRWTAAQADTQGGE